MRNLPSAYRLKSSGDTCSPIEIYDIFLDTRTLRLAQYNDNITFYDLDGVSQTYTAFPIKREPASKASDMSVGGVSVKVASVDRTMTAYLANNDFRGRRVVIRKIFTDLTTSSGDAAVIFDGVMDSPVVGEQWVEFNAVDRLTLSREVPKQRYMLLCNHKFGSAECFQGRASGDMYGTLKGTVAAGSTTERIYSTAMTSGDNFFKDGEVTFTSGQNANYRRDVTGNDQSSTYFDMDYPLPYTPVVGDNYTIRRGCDKTWLRCSGDFSNDANFMGFPSLPQSLTIR